MNAREPPGISDIFAPARHPHLLAPLCPHDFLLPPPRPACVAPVGVLHPVFSLHSASLSSFGRACVRTTRSGPLALHSRANLWLRWTSNCFPPFTGIRVASGDKGAEGREGRGRRSLLPRTRPESLSGPCIGCGQQPVLSVVLAQLVHKSRKECSLVG